MKYAEAEKQLLAGAEYFATLHRNSNIATIMRDEAWAVLHRMKNDSLNELVSMLNAEETVLLCIFAAHLCRTNEVPQ